MKPSFYPFAVLFLLSLAACDGGAAPDGGGGAAQDDSVFELAPEERHRYLPPAEGEPTTEDWARRFVEHLRRGSKDGLDFAKERLTLMGTPAAPFLVAEIEANMARGSAMGYLVNLCEVLGACGRPEDTAVLRALIAQSPPPVVRTTAYEALARLSTEADVPALIEALAFEREPAPFEAALRALAHAGGEEAIGFLESEVQRWLDLDQTAVTGDKAYSALLLCRDPKTADALVRLTPRLPPFQQVQAYGARIRFGDRDLVEALRPYLDPEKFPSAGTRELALQLLGELGDWETVLAQEDAAELKIQLAVVALLRRPEAREADLGRDVLDAFADQATDETLRLNALAGLVERGQEQRLDPYLRRLQGFPTVRGSGEALRVLSRPEFADARVAGILIERWGATGPEQHMDLLRALAVTGEAAAARFIADIAGDESVPTGMRRTAATVLANFDQETAVPLLLAFHRASPSPGRASLVIPGLGKHVAHPDADAFLRELTLDPAGDDEVRRLLFDAVPLIYRDRGHALLAQVLAESTRIAVRQYVETVLWRYY
jgi:HEAT repeat protein